MGIKTRISNIRLTPAVAIARLGGSDHPLESFTWGEDPDRFGAGQTVLVPQISLEVLPDGSVLGYLPGNIRFRDGERLRPVCPFFEVIATIKRGGQETDEPLTPRLLESVGASLSGLWFRVTAANRKAARRTGDEACAFGVDIRVNGTDHRRHPLNGISSRGRGAPLVFEHSPIPLGSFQVMRPVESSGSGGEVVRRDVVRARFTPARGEVYGPAAATFDLDSVTGRPFTIVPERNRILNGGAAWMTYSDSLPWSINPEPSNTYDGENSPRSANVSWGVVDDTCDAVIEATLAVGGDLYRASARVIVGPPNYAPDRRTFYSIADEFADRDPASVLSLEALACELGISERDLLVSYSVDLFRRAYEVASLMNVDAARKRMLLINDVADPEKFKDWPCTNDRTLRMKEDQAYLSTEGEEMLKDDPEESLLMASRLARSQHETTAQEEEVLRLLLRRVEDGQARLDQILRPPYAKFSELPPADPLSPMSRRDIRVDRHRATDMRMPPFMRDSDGYALSLTHSQYEKLIQLSKELQKERGPSDKGKKESREDPMPLPEDSPTRKRAEGAAKRRDKK